MVPSPRALSRCALSYSADRRLGMRTRDQRNCQNLALRRDLMFHHIHAPRRMKRFYGDHCHVQ
jgi:hypothetical protein